MDALALANLIRSVGEALASGAITVEEANALIEFIAAAFVAKQFDAAMARAGLQLVDDPPHMPGARGFQPKNAATPRF